MAKTVQDGKFVTESFVNTDGEYIVTTVPKRSAEETARMERLVAQLDKSRRKHRKRDDQ